MTNAQSKIDELFKLLKPLNRTQGEHSVSVTFYPGVKGGVINFMLDWKTLIGEKEFDDIDEAIEFAYYLQKQANINY
ncbi:hypothetical protein VF14_13460 [Nostoc linckia z18]|uniref:Uncharacterized protein n=2 Tax=Nostoc linckia TaxID=92942 RepID=A0A9Q6EL19_NOSLI|nr:hypothetical protein [Nostoc linckia]PHK42273.1 hypothetical protein VF12_03705 [Nostoc linckia z15]PHK45480.1 hypothetical protein VF13_16155 [Nostoc linckia z16]PHJ59058.1 hypothetical protein VF02_26140 [Nostoc linckia z1]PHJ61911.1 hypothetical protein VF05_27835 [Nostoc linckia z3]PHJ67828.1 hypothetical protein VF03_25585 [Nostoc linckia z2]